jgi:protein transport protein SEC61 subunit alpha
MAGRFLKFFSPFVRIMPEIKQPDREVSFKEKLMYTAIVLIIYLVMSNIRLYGMQTQNSIDYFYWLRTILASSRGTLTELGIGPIVTAGLIMQLLMGSKIIEVDMGDPYDRALFTGAQKVLSVFLTIFQTIAYLAGGAFGTSLDFQAEVAIFLQLFGAGVLIILMDEMLQKGWGIGSGVSLFIAAGVCSDIFVNAFSWFPSTGVGADNLPQGAIIAFFYALFHVQTSPAFTGTVWDTFIRPGTSKGGLSVLTTAGIFLLVVYFQCMKIEIPLTYAGYRGFKGKYPMKLLYVSNIPVILTQALYANVLFFGQLIAGPTSWLRSQFPNQSFLIDLIGQFQEPAAGSTNGQLTPTGGLVWLLTPPQGITSWGGLTWWQPLIYLGIFLFLCVFFSRIWVEVSGLAPRDIAAQIIDSGMQVPGFRRSDKVIEKILKRYIPTLTILCGLIVGLLSFTADALGALSTGTGILLTVGIVQNFAESISQEAMRSFLGLD